MISYFEIEALLEKFRKMDVTIHNMAKAIAHITILLERQDHENNLPTADQLDNLFAKYNNCKSCSGFKPGVVKDEHDS